MRDLTVSLIILGLKDSSAGWDNIYSKIVKQTYQHILPTLTHLFNLIIAKGIVPKDIKKLKSCPNLQKLKLHVGK